MSNNRTMSGVSHHFFPVSSRLGIPLSNDHMRVQEFRKLRLIRAVAMDRMTQGEFQDKANGDRLGVGTFSLLSRRLTVGFTCRA